MKVAFRTDASLAIGSGHVMRCLTLADALGLYGVQSVFLSRDHVGHLHQVVKARGYPLLSLGGGQGKIPASSHADWLGIDQQHDIIGTKNHLAGLSVDWLVVDHYGLDAAWEFALRSVCGRVMAIDDLANREHFVDALLDQNLGKTEADYEDLVSASCKLIIGPRYALVRPEFAKLRSESLSRRGQGRLRNLLITMGGVDKDNLTGAVLEALNQFSQSADLEVFVVMGSTALWRDYVIQQAQKLSFPTEVLVNVQNMASLMRDADLAIGAAGSTTWERCCMGLPTLQLVLAENQRPIANAMSMAGAALPLEITDLHVSLCAAISQLIVDRAQLFCMSNAAAKVVDGQGADRVARYLTGGIKE
jgi:UDP-2,4-diacetamido-2,4,6-trideoxy-beta-L-altropyranose hydrolase